MSKFSLADLQKLVGMLETSDIQGDLVKLGSFRSSKQFFKDIACAYLKEVAKQLGLDTYRVHFNPAGPALGGEALLESDKVFVHIGCPSVGVLYRKCILVGTRKVGTKVEPRFNSANFGNCWMDFSSLLEMPRVVARLQELIRASPSRS